MKIDNLNSVHKIIDLIINNRLDKNSICVDATLGNGFDTLKLSKLLNNTGKIYSFDIQKVAIENSISLFKKENIDTNNIIIINDNHNKIREYVKENIDFFIMNLGYLPSGDKNITTNYIEVITFLESTLEIMNKNAFGIIVFYPGHSEGMKEYIKVREYLETLPQKSFNVIDINLLNQKNYPPALTIIERI